MGQESTPVIACEAGKDHDTILPFKTIQSGTEKMKRVIQLSSEIFCKNGATALRAVFCRVVAIATSLSFSAG